MTDAKPKGMDASCGVRARSRKIRHVADSTAWVALAFFALSLAVYFPAARGPFVFDDLHSFAKNPDIAGAELAVSSLARAARAEYSPNRPVPKLTFGLQAALHGMDPLGFHLVNVLIHALAGFLLFLLLRITWSLAPALPGDSTAGKFFPLAAAALWLAHPVQTQSVAYVVQRMNSLAALFYLAALVCYARGRLSGGGKRAVAWFAGCVAAGLLALGSKEIAFTLPLFLFLYEWFFFQDLSGRWLGRMLPAVIALLLVSACVLLVYSDFHPLIRIQQSYENRPFTMAQRVLTEFRVVAWYVSLFLVPAPGRQNLDHDFPLSRSFLDPPSTALALAFIVLSLAGAAFFAKKHRLAAFCVFWFFGNLALESSVFALEIVFEHRMYLPSMLLSALLTILLLKVVRRPGVRAGVLAGAVLVLCSLTFARSAVWADNHRLWSDAAEKSPQKARPLLNLGTLYLQDEKPGQAAAVFEKAMALGLDKRQEPWTWFHLAKAYGMAGDRRKEMEAYRRTLALDPDHAEAHNNLGRRLVDAGRLKEGLSHVEASLRLAPDNPRAHLNAGLACWKLDNPGRAISHYQKALSLDPDYMLAHNNLAVIYAQEGRAQEAAAHFREALRISREQGMDDKTAGAHFNLARLLLTQGKPDEAREHLLAAARLNPSLAGPAQRLLSQADQQMKQETHAAQ
ncbi:MAG: tetratricopeptide repeat protein [Deltaproteobacteria bacterium]|nr:tetratricopeptide repeat protein [Deltaproteobacteria bacterium]